MKHQGPLLSRRSQEGCFLTVLCCLLFATVASAQWQSTTYTLKGGWNSIYLHGDAKHDTIPNVITNGNVLELWRWNPNPVQAQFTASPLLPTAGMPEWSVWARGSGANTLTELTGQSAYLVKCAGTASNSYSLSITQAILPPRANWVRSGANFIGFPSFKNGSNYPLFSNYFATFPAATAATAKIFKYVGGDLGASNPLQIFSPTSERLDRTQAYWFSSEVVGNFYAPMEFNLSHADGLTFGRTGSASTLRLRNRTAAAVTLTLDPVSSAAAPAGQTSVVGAVPLTRRSYNSSTQVWTETPITGAYTEVVGPQSTLELSFGVNRVAMGGADDSLYASFLRVRDGGNLFEVFVPTSAQKASLAGLWVGDATLTNVSSQVSNGAKAVATVANGVVTGVSVSGTGGFGYTAPPAVSFSAPGVGVTATATAIVAGGSVTGFTVQNPGSGYTEAPRVTVALPPALSGTSVARTFPLRTLLHVADNGTARLLSQAYIGKLAAAPNNIGVATQQSLLRPADLSTAQRLVAAHMPLDQAISAGSGSVAVPGTLVRTISLPYDDATNPFVHQYHPDHDNKNARMQPVGNKVESHTVTRTCTFTFTTVPPAEERVFTMASGSTAGFAAGMQVDFYSGASVVATGYITTVNGNRQFSVTIPVPRGGSTAAVFNLSGTYLGSFSPASTGSSTVSGWGSTVIGGTYREVISGLHANAIQLDGTFELRRVSESGLLVQPP